MGITHSTYQRLPPPLTHLAATLRGGYLKWWRYGPETPSIIEEALERDGWSSEKWQDWQAARLEYVLHKAATQVPYYRAMWEKRRAAGDDSTCTELSNWPILEKDAVRASPESFVPDGRPSPRLFRDRTSGTSGTPITVFSSRQSLRRWFGTFEARIRRWHGVSYSQGWAMLGGQLVVPFARTRPPFWVHNKSLSQLYVSTQHISQSFAPAISRAIARHRPSHMIGYPSSLAALASIMLTDGIEAPESLRVVFSNSEVLTQSQRETISRGFGCPVRDTYGMAEMVAAASECPEGSLHVWPDVGYLELASGSGELKPVPPTGGMSSDPGELVATGLMNDDMLLIRYRTGDIAEPSSGSCNCGRTSTVLTALGGRTSDLILTRDGRSIFWINPVFYGLPVNEAQVIQESLDELVVKLVPSAGFQQADSDQIVSRVRSRVGEMSVDVVTVPHIERGPSGKFRPVLSRISSDQ